MEMKLNIETPLHLHERKKLNIYVCLFCVDMLKFTNVHCPFFVKILECEVCCDIPSVQVIFSDFNSCLLFGVIRRGVTIVVSEHSRSVVRSYFC